MSGAYLYGWCTDPEGWVKVLVTEGGKLIIDPSEIFENDPTDDEHGKAPDSDWAYEHKNDASAHHERYTDDESRAAIGDIFNSNGVLIKGLNIDYFDVINFKHFTMRYGADSNHSVRIHSVNYSPIIRFLASREGVGYVPAYIDIYNGSAYERVAVQPVVDDKIADHTGVADAHHAKYTDEEARAAVGYNGTKYWGCAGCYFDANLPASDNIIKGSNGDIKAAADGIAFNAGVLLPHGAVITSVIIRGNAGAEEETWTLYRKTLSTGAGSIIASAAINTADTSIDTPTVDNSLYAYILGTSSLDTDDTIYGATITYTV